MCRSGSFTLVGCTVAPPPPPPRAPHLVAQLAGDSEWATSEAELVNKGNKRKREDGESSNAAWACTC